MSDYDDLDELENGTEPLNAREWIEDIFKTTVPGILLILLIRSAIAEPFRIPSGSMVPTLEIGDHILVTKYTYGFRVPLTRIPMGELDYPDRGDIIVFVYPPSDQDEDALSHWLDLPFYPFATLDYVKRVVGLPGDAIKVINNTVYINGKPQTKNIKRDYAYIDDRCTHYQTELQSESLQGYNHDILVNKGTFRSTSYNMEKEIPEGYVFVMGDNRDHSSDSRIWGLVPLRNIKGKARFVWFSNDQCSPGIPLLGKIRNDRFGSPLY